MCRQRTSSIPRSVRRSMFTDSPPSGGFNVIVPPAFSAGGSSFMIASAVVVFPQPDSPASPTASPGCIDEVDPGDDRLAVPVHGQPLDLEQRAHACACSRGLICSSYA